MRTHATFMFSVALSLTGIACENTSSAPSTKSTSLAQKAVDYPAQYRFPINGAPVASSPRPGTERTAGDTEAFLRFELYGAVKAWSDPTAPQYRAPPPRSIDEHDGKARSYLLSVGVPESELGTRHHLVGYKSEGPPGQGDLPRELLGYTTSYERQLRGYTVVDSVASVQVTEETVPVALSISWPPAPGDDVFVQADRLKSLLQRGWTPKFPSTSPVASSEVVLHHSPVDASKLEWMAVIRVNYATARSPFSDYDADGNELNFYGWRDDSQGR